MPDRGRVVLRRGLDLPIPGAPRPVVEDARMPREFALLGSDHPELRLFLRVAEGERVRVGQALMADRRRPDLRLVSPAAGIVRTARPDARARGAMVVVAEEDDGADEEERQHLSFGGLDLEGAQRLSRAELVARLLETGDWVSLRERPGDRIPDPDARPDALLVRLTDSNPLAAPIGPILEGREDDLRIGIAALARLVDEGPVFVSQPPEVALPTEDLPGVRVFTFAGPHPAGLAGTQIHHLFPIRDRRRVWHVGAQETLAIGHALRTARVDTRRVVALAGPQVRRPRLLRTRIGSDVEALVANELLPGECRIVSGSPLSGRVIARPERHLGRHHHQISVLPEVDADSGPGWLLPFFGRTRRMPPWRRRLPWSTERHGEPSAMLPLDFFDAVSPLRLPFGLLLRALAAGDVETARRLGALELVEEDVALFTYLCPAKVEYGERLRAVLPTERRGGA